jgi:S-adenosylmethionine:tRNA ribosyltransferase-isomerase
MTRIDALDRLSSVDFVLDPALEAREPPEARGLRRDEVRLLVSRAGDPYEISHHRFVELPALLDPGDLLVINVSATVPAVLDSADRTLVVHVSTPLPGGGWAIELRTPERGSSRPYPPWEPGQPNELVGQRIELVGGACAVLRSRYSQRLWVADLIGLGARTVTDYLLRYGRPIRYSYVDRDWPLSAYRSVFATEPGSAEMPSASRPFTDAVMTRLASSGVVVAPITLHTGVASLQAQEKPYPERFAVSADTARLVNQARAAGRRVIAVGTTVVRAIETAADADGTVAPAAGWTDLVVTPRRGVRAIDGLLTGFHEPRASHLMMLEAVVGRDLLEASYAEAIRRRYLWHEFGDVNLLVAG